MSNWDQTSNLLGNISEQFQPAVDFVEGFNEFVIRLDEINQTVATVINTINTIASPSIPNIQREALKQIQTSIKEYIDGFFSSGTFILPVLPLEGEKYEKSQINFASISGGFEGFKERVNASFYDEFDNARPIFGDSAYTAAIVCLVDSSDENVILQTLNTLKNLFNFNIEIGVNISDVKNLSAAPGDKEIVLVWEHDISGFTPTHFQIELNTAQEIGFTLLDTVLNTTKTKYTAKNLVNNTSYTFKITPLISTNNIKGNPVFVTSSPNALRSTDTSGLKACSNFSCEYVNSVRKNKCSLLNPNFNESTCFFGGTTCDQYKNKNCKYNNGSKCTSAGFTIDKSKANNTSGIPLVIPNSSLYVSTFCQNGKNGLVCDGYTEKEVNRSGSLPNWEGGSLKTFFPSQVGSVLNGLNGVVDALFATTAEVSDASSTFVNLLSDSINVFKELLQGLTNLLQDLQDLFTLPTADFWLLQIEPNSGGTNYFLNEFNNASNFPTSGTNGYTTGFVIFMGSSDSNLVNLEYSAWKQFFSI